MSRENGQYQEQGFDDVASEEIIQTIKVLTGELRKRGLPAMYLADPDQQATINQLTENLNRAKVDLANAQTQLEREIANCNQFWQEKHNKEIAELKVAMAQYSSESFETHARKLSEHLSEIMNERYEIGEELTKLEVNMIIETVRADIHASITVGKPLFLFVDKALPALKERYEQLRQRAEELELTDEKPRSMEQALLRIRAMEAITNPDDPNYDPTGESFHLSAQSANPISADVYQALQREQQAVIEATVAEQKAQLETELRQKHTTNQAKELQGIKREARKALKIVATDRPAYGPIRLRNHWIAEADALIKINRFEGDMRVYEWLKDASDSTLSTLMNSDD